MKHLFLFTIGPVQSFIAQARKTMDLKAGSDILSKLTRTGILTTVDKFSAELIFPYWPKEGTPESMPNKFLAEVNLEPDQAELMGNTVEGDVRKAFRKMAEKALMNMKPRNAEQAFQEKFFEQIESHLEVYWAFEKLENDQDYRRAYQQIEQNLGVVKNIRAFSQLPPDEDGRKCSVSGERDALVFSSINNYVPAFVVSHKRQKLSELENRLQNLPIAITNSSDVILAQGEGLCAVVATKRFYTEKKFSSTADIALLDFFHAIEANRGQEKLENLKWWDKNRISDGQIFYPENHREKYLVKQGYPPNLAGQVDKIKKAYKDLMVFARSKGISTPSSYYALLTFDGDRMGATWAGDEEYIKPEADLKEFQKALSKQLYHFAQKAKGTLDNGRGQTIYAGGDDFSGFVNLHYLFEVMSELRTLYQEEVQDKLKEYLAEGTILSFSAGVCIAHYKNPLGEVVRFAHKAQDYAKSEQGVNRNAFAFYLMKRSGEIQQAATRWGKKGLENLEALETVTRLMQEGCFSNTFISALSYEFMGLIGRNKGTHHDFDRFDSIIEQEIKRLVYRSKIDEGIKKHIESQPDLKKEELIERMQKSVDKLFDSQEWRVENFLHWLEIADFLTRQPDQYAN